MLLRGLPSGADVDFDQATSKTRSTDGRPTSPLRLETNKEFHADAGYEDKHACFYRSIELEAEKDTTMRLCSRVRAYRRFNAYADHGRSCYLRRKREPDVNKRRGTHLALSLSSLERGTGGVPDTLPGHTQPGRRSRRSRCLCRPSHHLSKPWGEDTGYSINQVLWTFAERRIGSVHDID